MRRPWICLFLGLALLAAGCSEDRDRDSKPPLVKTREAQRMEAAGETFSGQVKGRRETDLSFQVGGEIIGRWVDVGSAVRAGDTLMRLSPRDVRQQLGRAQAQTASAKAQLELAQANLARYEELFAGDAVPEAVLDQYRTSHRAAEAAYQSALAAEQEAQNALSYTDLAAPADGAISQIQAEAGQVVTAGQTVMTLMQADELEAEVFLPENRLALAPPGASVGVRFWASPAEVPGHVREVAPMADAARMYRVRVTLEEIPAGIEAGMTASIFFPEETGADGGMLLPLGAVYQTGSEPQVWVVQDGKAVTKPIRILAYRGDNVVASGLAPGDHVVVSGVHKLQPGQAVREEATP